jgi:hypothetical protein
MIGRVPGIFVLGRVALGTALGIISIVVYIRDQAVE